VELVNLGYTDIDSVRRALDENKLDLYDNARVGVQFYEDFLEKMTRNEVKLIGDIVAAAGRKYFPEAEITTMGSYRRGSEKCGDVDVLITHRKFSKCIPKGAMDELVERLRDEGHISHHLTKVDTIHKRTLPMRVGNLDDILMNTSKKAASYMGVFISPTVPGKHRRIDIKFYPYQQKPSATLYFTGNGWFNRAMRWYAKQKKGMKLDDTGLFILTKNEEKKMGFEGKRLKVKSEKEIFDHLHLVYKEPHERDCFDAVVPKSDQDFGFDMNPNHSDFEPETRLSWVE
jgi:DNA polymerase/3'-5' exonuclease PolX